MPNGYTGKVLRIDLSRRLVQVECPDDVFYRTYMGGSALGAAYLLKEMEPGVDPLSSGNILVISTGVLTGAPIGGLSRVMATAKSPLTGAIGDSQGGGFWAPELKFAGYDAIVIKGQSPDPVYMWICDEQVEIRDATHLWGKTTGETEDAIRSELDDTRIQVLQIGPAGEQLVRFASLINSRNRACGRTGMGAVMGSKNLKAIAVRGHGRPEMHDRDAIRELARWGRDNLESSDAYTTAVYGTAGVNVDALQRSGGLPTKNWSSGVFDGWENIWGQTMNQTILKERDTCYGCIMRCKRVVETTDDYAVDPQYGGPEYETVACLGSYCGIDDLAAIAKGNELCNKYGLDTISCGATIAFAMDCFEHGLLTLEDTGGIDLHFGNAHSMVELIEAIAERRGLGDTLAEGSYRAAQQIGKGADRLVVHVKKSELPAHMPQTKRSLALVYAVNPFGADHLSSDHDPAYSPGAGARGLGRLSSLGLIAPQETTELSPEKMRFAYRTECVYSALDSLGTCAFVWGPSWQLYDLHQLVDLIRAVTGWNMSLYELMLLGERRLNMLRAFNTHEGLGKTDDALPDKLYEPLHGGPTDGVALDRGSIDEALAQYYSIAGWCEDGSPSTGKLMELGLEWVADMLA